MKSGARRRSLYHFDLPVSQPMTFCVGQEQLSVLRGDGLYLIRGGKWGSFHHTIDDASGPSAERRHDGSWTSLRCFPPMLG